MPFLVKVAKYREESGNFKFDSEVLAQHTSPPLVDGQEHEIIIQLGLRDFKNPKVILSSPQTRAVMTARLIKKQLFPELKVLIDKNLNEIPFSIWPEPKLGYGSTFVREKFLESFSSDSLLESRASIHERVKKVLAYSEILAVTHTFFMKIVESCIFEPDLFSQPSLLKRHLDVNNRIYKYLHVINTGSQGGFHTIKTEDLNKINR